MSEDSNQPRSYDAVLGGQEAPTTGVVLGGCEGVKKRFSSAVAEQRIAALQAALNFGAFGLDLAIQALQDESEAVRRVAYVLLREKKQPEVRKALREFNFYQFFECIRTLKAGIDTAISPDGETFASLQGKAIKVWSLHTDELLCSIPKLPRAKESFLVGSDGEIFVRSVNRSSYCIETWHQGEHVHTLYGHEGPISAIALSPEGQTLASGSHDRTIKIWNLKTGKLICTFSSLLTWGTHTDAVLCLAFSPDGQTLLSGSADRTIKLWNLRTRDRPRTLKGHFSGIQALAVSPDGKTLSSASWNRRLRLWHIGSGEAIATIEGLGNFNCLAFSPDSRILATGSSDRTINLWDLRQNDVGETASQPEMVPTHVLTGHENSISCLAFSGDGRTLISGSQDKTIKVWGIS